MNDLASAITKLRTLEKERKPAGDDAALSDAIGRFRALKEKKATADDFWGPGGPPVDMQMANEGATGEVVEQRSALDTAKELGLSAVNVVTGAVGDTIQAAGLGIEHMAKQNALRMIEGEWPKNSPVTARQVLDHIDPKPISKAGAAIKEATRIPDVPGMENSLTAHVGGGLGFVAAAAGAPLAAGLRGAAAMVPGILAGGATQGVANFHIAADAAERAGASRAEAERQAFPSFLAGVGIGGAAGALPVKILTRVNAKAGGELGRILTDAVVFGGLASGQTAANDLLLEHTTGEEYDIARDAIEAFLPGFLVGGIAGSAGAAGRKLGKPKSPESPVSSPEDAPPQPAQPPEVQSALGKQLLDVDAILARDAETQAQGSGALRELSGEHGEGLGERSAREGAAREADLPPGDSGVSGRVSPAREAAPKEAAPPPEAEAVAKPEFKRWFGHSKAVDAEGKPVVAHHGTRALEFSEFQEPNVEGEIGGIYFSTNPKEAASYADSGGAFANRPDEGGKPRMIDAHLHVENPFIDDVHSKTNDEGIYTKERVEELKAEGYDGIFYSRDGEIKTAADADEIVVFSRYQIKSASGNSGTFDVSSADIFDKPKPTKPTPPEIPDSSKAEPKPAPEVKAAEGEPEGYALQRKSIDKTVKDLGIEPTEKTEIIGDEEAIGRAAKRLAENENAGRELLDELETRMRPSALDEGALLLHELTRAMNERDAAQKSLDGGNKDARARVEAATEQVARVERLSKQSISDPARRLRFQQVFMRKDFSSEGIRRTYEAARGGEKLTEKGRLDVEAKAKAMAEILVKERDVTTNAENAHRITVLEQTMKEIEADIAKGGRARLHKTAAESSRKKIDDLFKELGTLAGRASANLDPKVAVTVGKLALEHIRLGYHELAAFTNEMVKRAGESVRPYIAQAWDAATSEHRTGLARPIAERIAAKEPIGAPMRNLVRHLLEHGVTDREQLVGEVRKLLPKLTRDQVVDAVGGYGEFRPLSQDEIARKARDIRGELRAESKLRDMEAGLAAKRSGFEMREPTDAERRTMRKIADEKKRLGLTEEHATKQVKSAIESAERSLAEYERRIREHDLSEKPTLQGPDVESVAALKAERDALVAKRDKARREIQELRDLEKPRKDPEEARLERMVANVEERIAAGGKAKETPETQSVDTEAVSRLRARHAQLSERLAEMRKKTPRSDAEKRAQAVAKQVADLEQRIAKGDTAPKGQRQGPEVESVAKLIEKRAELSKELAEMRRQAEAKRDPAETRLEKQIAAIQERIAKGQTKGKGEKQGPDTAMVEALKKERDALNERLAEMRKAERPKRSKEEIAREAFMKRNQREIDRLNERLQYGDFIPREKRAERPRTKEEIEVARLKKRKIAEIRQGEERYKRALRSGPRRALDTAGELAGVTMDLLTSVDLPPVLRQGLWLTARHPVLSARAYVRSWEAIVSRKKADALEAETQLHDDYQTLKDHGLDFTGYADELSRQEENIRSRISKNVPILANSQRGFVAYMNTLRFLVGRAKLKQLGESATKDDIKSVARWINDLSGRGKFNNPKADMAVEFLRKGLFAPRLYLSRINMLTFSAMRHATPRVRWMIGKDLAIQLSGIAAGMIFLNTVLDGDDIETDWRATDVFKLVVGDSHIDLTAGIQQWWRFLGQNWESERLTSKGDVRDTTLGETIGKMTENKLLPPISAAFDIKRVLQGKEVRYEEKTVLEVIRDAITPLSPKDVLDTMEAQGIPRGIAISILGLHGAGLQTYGANQ